MIWAGIGLREAADGAAFDDALALAGTRPDALACLAAKATPALVAWASTQGLPLTRLDEHDIAGLETPTTSPRIAARCRMRWRGSPVAITPWRPVCGKN